ncbi:lactonase family protein [Pseudoflavitalea sp. G-6-1-2]|uniref:lactonase family protein n=1 Tax=Pseudoflavitalea sp. G-6-1-2 TaxID=2728841 RepID=UPI001469F2E1|nr:lactonase family protein [Pseudoflavitalea sp. G-6-1-2]NML23780.1 lactonase family protein [Pseudoflavitalea sp. G-6-1-2]
MKNLLASILFLLLALKGFSQTQYLLVGTYTQGKGEGIYVYKFDQKSGKLTQHSKVVTNNPSYLEVSPDQKFVYAVHEEPKDQAQVSAYAFDKTKGTLRLINQQPTNGAHPCYVSVDKTGKWVAVGNYSGGSFSVYHVNADGGLQPAAKTIRHYGWGADKKRQGSPHVHSTVFSPDNKFLIVQDLGVDKIFTYAFSADTGVSDSAIAFTATSAGSGPRHLVFHPRKDIAYLMEEMSGDIVTFRYNTGRFNPIQNVSALPEDYNGDIGSADIHVSPDGKFVYGSNRGQSNDIAIFRTEDPTGMLRHVANEPAQGTGTRNFTIHPSGNYLLAAYQTSDKIVVYKRNKKTGTLTLLQQSVEVGNPVCLKWIQ